MRRRKPTQSLWRRKRPKRRVKTETAKNNPVEGIRAPILIAKPYPHLLHFAARARRRVSPRMDVPKALKAGQDLSLDTQNIELFGANKFT